MKIKNLNIFFAFAACLLMFTSCLDYNSRGANSGYCDQFGCYVCDNFGCYSVGDDFGTAGAAPGSPCQADVECELGCYCDFSNSPDGLVGACAEAGLCNSDRDCPSEFSCDDRSSCVPTTRPDLPIPGGSNQQCTEDSDCPFSEYCDEATNICIVSVGCNKDDQCGLGLECDTTRNTCVPESCETQDDCQEGCYCNEEAQECVETSKCDEGCAEGLICDVPRNTCRPEAVTCNTTVASTTPLPTCPEGETPSYGEDGAPTGLCLAIAECPDGPPFSCEDVATEGECISDARCSPVYRGSNCTDPQGESCVNGSADCTCEVFSYDFCEDVGATVQ